MNGRDVSDIKERLKREMTTEQIATAQQKAKEYSERYQKPDAKRGMQVAGGTGFFISADGFFMTAAHILEGTVRERIICQGKTFSVSRVLVDKNLDLAVLKVTGLAPFTFLPIVNSGGIKLGDEVFTLGFPLVGVQ
jgi:serine protease Do